MASHLKGVAKSTTSDQIRKELCEYKRNNPASTQKDLQRSLEGKFQLKVSQGIISNTLKLSDDYLFAEIEKGRAEIKRHKPAKYPDMEKVQSLEDIVSAIIENNVEDDGEDNTVSLEPVTRKEALMASNTLHNFMIQYKNTTPELLDAIRKVRNEF